VLCYISSKLNFISNVGFPQWDDTSSLVRLDANFLISIQLD